MQVTLFEKADHTIISSIEWMDLMKRIRDGFWRDIVEQSRRECFGRDDLKDQLPAFGTSVTFVGGDEAVNVVKYNHIVSIDFNKAITDTNDGAEKIAQSREICCRIPSVVGFYITKSGRGFRIFVLVNSNIDEHKIIYHPIQEYFEQILGLQADDKYRDITRLSFVSYDPDCFYRSIESSETFKIESIIPFKNKSHQEIPTISVIIKKISEYLGKTYDFRYDALAQVLQYRIKPNLGHAIPISTHWMNINDRLNDQIVSDINANCVEVTYNQFKWIIDNNYIADIFNPIEEFDSHLPEWDGEDRIEAFANSLNTNNSHAFANDVKSWLVNMYRLWLGKGIDKANIMILQSDDSGSGKTAWALKILPPSLRQYMYVGIASQTLFHSQEKIKNNLLFIAEDYIGNFSDIISLPTKASYIITTSKRIQDQTVIDKNAISYHSIKTNDENVTALVINYPELYAQVKFLAKV